MFIPSDRKELLFDNTVEERIKPIVHCDAKFLALGLGVGQYPERQNLGANANPLICILPDAKPKCKPVEYRLCWVPTQNSGVGHVHFMFFVLILFALGSQRKPSFQWNMGLTGI